MKAVYGKICLFKLIKNDFQSDRDIEMNVNIVNRHILHQKSLWGCKNDGLWTRGTSTHVTRPKKPHKVEVGFPHRKWYQNCTGMWLWIFRPSPDAVPQRKCIRWSDVFWRDEKGRRWRVKTRDMVPLRGQARTRQKKSPGDVVRKVPVLSDDVTGQILAFRCRCEERPGMRH